MAKVVAVIASTHHPFYYRASTATGGDRPPFADPRLRRAVSLALDRQALTRSLQLGRALPLGQPLPPGIFGHAPDLPPQPRDLEAARRLGVPASACIVLEDSDTGAHAAAAARMRVIVIPDGRAPSAETLAIATAVHASATEALATLGALLGL